jgi:hypothetical protein
MIGEIERLWAVMLEYHFSRQSFVENAVRRFIGLMQA